MAIRNIVKEGDPILNKVCRPVTNFDDRLATLLDDMRETMIAADGVGLAGPQVGMMRRLFVVWDTTDAPEEIPETKIGPSKSIFYLFSFSFFLTTTLYSCSLYIITYINAITRSKLPVSL